MKSCAMKTEIVAADLELVTGAWLLTYRDYRTPVSQRLVSEWGNALYYKKPTRLGRVLGVEVSPNALNEIFAERARRPEIASPTSGALRHSDWPADSPVGPLKQYTIGP